MVKFKQLWISRKYLWADLNTNELVVWAARRLKYRSAKSQLGRGLSYRYTSCMAEWPHFKPPAKQIFQNAKWEIDIFPLISVFYFYHSTYQPIWIPWKRCLGPECKNHFIQTFYLNDHCIRKDSFQFFLQIASPCKFLCSSMNGVSRV